MASFSLSFNFAAASEGPVYALWVAHPGAHKGRTVYLGSDQAMLRDCLQSAVWDAGNGTADFVAARILAPAPSQEVDDIARALQEAGVDARYISVAFTGRPQREIKISIWQARCAGDCSFSPAFFETLWGREPPDNRFDPAIGCDMRSNLRAMMSNPRDLVVGRGTRYSDGERAAAAVSQYRSGKTAPVTKANGNGNGTGGARPAANE